MALRKIQTIVDELSAEQFTRIVEAGIKAEDPELGRTLTPPTIKVRVYNAEGKPQVARLHSVAIEGMQCETVGSKDK